MTPEGLLTREADEEEPLSPTTTLPSGDLSKFAPGSLPSGALSVSLSVPPSTALGTALGVPLGTALETSREISVGSAEGVAEYRGVGVTKTTEVEAGPLGTESGMELASAPVDGELVGPGLLGGTSLGEPRAWTL